MKRIYSFVAIMLASILVYAQGGTSNLPLSIAPNPMTVSPSSSQNYILTTSYLSPAGSNATAGAASPEVQYFDGLGRPIEKVSVMGSQNGFDIVSMQTYDAFGNPEKTYLSYSKSGNKGAFIDKSSFISNQNTFLSGLYGSTDGAKGYSTAEYEKSPLNRLIKQYSPGNDWQTRPVMTDYSTNKDTIVQCWFFSGDSYSAYTYANGTLFLTVTTDEDGKKTKEYRDKQGKVVLQKTSSSETRYCYDAFDRLRCVVPPTATGPGDVNNVYSYKYDRRGRLIEKKIPGALPVYYIYDSRDRLVLTQDGRLRTQEVFTGSYYKKTPGWKYVIYDNFNRSVEEGTFISDLSRDFFTSWVGAKINYPQGLTRTPLKYLYYDNYSNVPVANNPHTGDWNAMSLSQASSNIGRITAENVKLLDTQSDMTIWLFKAYYYDKYGRVIQTAADNHLGGKTYVTNAYNFVGQVIQTRFRNIADGTDTYFDQFSDYDHRGRPVKTRMKINGPSEILLAANSYNEAGNLMAKYLHSENSGAFIQRNDYTYNIRNWLTGINDPASFSENDKFGLKLEYNLISSTSATASYNGNIASMVWGNPTNPNMRYNFQYDPLNRLSRAFFVKTGYSPLALTESYLYYKDGNIKNLGRYNRTGDMIDNLNMSYSANQITSLADVSGWGVNGIGGGLHYPGGPTPVDFYYDSNGNLAVEHFKQIYNDYNILNLPKSMWAIYKNNTTNTYFYTYDGEKLRKCTESNGTATKLDYCGPFVYNTANGIRSLAYIITPEGRAVANGTSWNYEYNLTDHLGNVRAVIKKGSGGLAEMIQERHFYPFGMEIRDLSSGTSTNKYLYNGKEFEDEFDQHLYDYGARFYDPELGRWNMPDPMAEKYYAWSPYSYGLDKPISNMDVGGHFVFKDAAHRPQLTLLLQNISKALDNQNIMSNLQKFSGLSANTIRDQFKFNSGPEIVERDLYGQYHGFTPRKFGGKVIQLDRLLINTLENSIKDRGNLSEYNSALALVLLTILHEYNHSGDLQVDGIQSDADQPLDNCLGSQFEKRAFGVLSRNVEDINKYFSPNEKDKKENKENEKNRNDFMNTIRNLPVGNYKVVNGEFVRTN